MVRYARGATPSWLKEKGGSPGKCQWSPETPNWMEPNVLVVRGGTYNGRTPVPDNQNALRSLARLERLGAAPSAAEVDRLDRKSVV